MKCECCEKDKEDVKPHPAMTAYAWNGEGEDPNRDLIVCDDCWAEYEAYYTERWEAYYAGLL